MKWLPRTRIINVNTRTCDAAARAHVTLVDIDVTVERHESIERVPVQVVNISFYCYRCRTFDLLIPTAIPVRATPIGDENSDNLYLMFVATMAFWALHGKIDVRGPPPPEPTTSISEYLNTQ